MERKTHPIKLHLDPAGGESAGGWEYTTGAPGNARYRYRYDGGSHGNGRVRSVVGTGEQLLDIQLQHSPKDGFAIREVTFEDPKTQLSFERLSDTHVVIHNLNVEVQEGYYSVIVADGDVDVSCDPMISNLPRSP